LFPGEGRIITCTSPSKTFNGAGLQVANIIIEDPQLQEKWQEQGGPELSSPLGLAATRGAYQGGGPWLEELKKYLDENFRFMAGFVRRHMPGAALKLPEGTYLAWIDCRGYGLSDDDLSRLLVEKGKVLLESGKMFGPEGAGFQRMNVACPRAVLQEGLRRMAAVLENG
jgi:cystathionine beta-lyase